MPNGSSAPYHETAMIPGFSLSIRDLVLPAIGLVLAILACLIALLLGSVPAGFGDLALVLGGAVFLAGAVLIGVLAVREP